MLPPLSQWRWPTVRFRASSMQDARQQSNAAQGSPLSVLATGRPLHA